MAKFTLTDEEFDRLLAAAETDDDIAALREMVKEAGAIDDLLALEDWRNQTLKFLGPMTRLDQAMARLSAKAGLLHSPDVKAVRRRLVALKKELGIPVADAEEEGENAAAEAAAVAAAAAGPMPLTETAGGGFETFFAANLPNVTHFSASEFLFKGGAHAENGLNTDPPEALWPNMVPLARLLNLFRSQVGAPVRLTSIYRSPAYNAAVGGKPESQHLDFKAADFVVSGNSGTPADWAQRMRDLRSAGVFSGGIGTYASFVHVDVRGTDVDWTG